MAKRVFSIFRGSSLQDGDDNKSIVEQIPMAKRAFSLFNSNDNPEDNKNPVKKNPVSSLQDGDKNNDIVEQIKIMGEAIQEVLLVDKKSLEITSKKCFSNLKHNMMNTAKFVTLEFRARFQALVIAVGHIVETLKDDLNVVKTKVDNLETKFEDLEKRFEKTTIELGELKEIIGQQTSLLRNIAANIATIESTLLDEAEKAGQA